MAQVQGPVKRTKVRAKESPELTRREVESREHGNTSKLPKVKHREKKPAFGEVEEKALKAAYHSLCIPMEDKQQRVSEWLELNARKNKDLKTWLDKKTAWYEDLVDFSAKQFATELASQDFTKDDARLYGDALCTSQSAFRSVGSFQAAQNVVNIVTRGVVRSSSEVLSDLAKYAASDSEHAHLEKARSDVGSKNRVMKGLLDLATDLHDSEHDRGFALQQLENVLGRLEGKQVSRASAPSGVINLDDVRKQKEKTATLVPSPSFDRTKSSDESTDAKKPNKSEVKREKTVKKKASGADSDQGAPTQEGIGSTTTQSPAGKPATSGEPPLLTTPRRAPAPRGANKSKGEKPDITPGNDVSASASVAVSGSEGEKPEVSVQPKPHVRQPSGASGNTNSNLATAYLNALKQNQQNPQNQ